MSRIPVGIVERGEYFISASFRLSVSPSPLRLTRPLRRFFIFPGNRGFISSFSGFRLRQYDPTQSVRVEFDGVLVCEFA